MPLDEFVAEYHFSSRHERIIAAPRDVVQRAAQEWQPRESLLWRVLLLGRGLGLPKGTMRQWAEGLGFLCLADTDDEIVYAQAGRFWSLRERNALVSPRTAEDLRAIKDPNVAVAAMTLRFESIAPGRTRVSTETRGARSARNRAAHFVCTGS